MTETDILFVEARTSGLRGLLCQWVENFYESDHKVQIPVDSRVAAQNLDQLLWTFSQASFVPHRVLAAAPSQAVVEPVVITIGEMLLDGYPVAICAGPVHLDFLLHFRQVVHFVLLDDAERRQESRLLWLQAKDEGFRLRHLPFAQNQPPAFPPATHSD